MTRPSTVAGESICTTGTASKEPVPGRRRTAGGPSVTLHGFRVLLRHLRFVAVGLVINLVGATALCVVVVAHLSLAVLFFAVVLPAMRGPHPRP